MAGSRNTFVGQTGPLDTGPLDTGSAQTPPVAGATEDAPPGDPDVPPGGERFPGHGMPSFSLGRFEVIETLGRGGMGEVMRVWDPKLRRRVALKRVRSLNSALRLRFMDEVGVTAALNHPGVVPLHELGEDGDGLPFFVMPIVQGRTLTAAIAEVHREALPPGLDELRARLAPLLDAFVRVCETVAYAHSRGVLHRDLKPDNVMLGAYGETFVLDWGIARLRSEADPEQSQQVRPLSGGAGTRVGAAMGTPGYMSPEQAAGAWDRVDARSDVWSLGAMLFQIVTGRIPPPDRPPELAPPIPRELISLLGKALAADPAARHPDALALAAEVRAWRDGQKVTAHDYSFREELLRTLRANAGRLTLVIAALLVIGVVAVGAAFEIGRERDRAQAAEEGSRRQLDAAVIDAAKRRWEARDGVGAGMLAAASLGRGETPEMRGMVLAARSRWGPRWLGSVALDQGCTDLAISPDGARIACASTLETDVNVLVFELDATAAGPGVRVVARPGAWPVAWSADGELLAVTERGDLVITRRDDAAVVARFKVCDGDGAIALAGLEAHRFAVACHEGDTVIWGADGAPIERLGPALRAAQTLQPTAEGLLIVSSSQAVLHRPGAPDRDLQGLGFEAIRGLVVGPGGLAMRAGAVGATVGRLWTWPLERPAQLLQGHRADLQDAAFAGPDLLTTSDDGTVRQWRVPDGAPLDLIAPMRGPITAMVAHAGRLYTTFARAASGSEPRADHDARAASGSEPRADHDARAASGSEPRADHDARHPALGVWALDDDTWSPSRPLPTGENLYALARCGDRLFGAGRAATIRDLSHREGPSWGVDFQVQALACEDEAVVAVGVGQAARLDLRSGLVSALPEDEGGVWLVEAGGAAARIDGDQRLLLRNGGPWRRIEIPASAAGVRPDVAFAALSPDGAQVLAMVDESAAAVYDTRTGALLARPDGPAVGSGIPDWSSDGRFAAVGWRDGLLRVWSAADWTVAFEAKLDGWPRSVVFSPDSRLMLEVNHDGTGHVWEVGTWKLRATLPFLGRLRRAVFAADGRSVWVTSSDAALFSLDLGLLDAPAESLVAEQTSRWGLAADGAELVPVD